MTWQPPKQQLEDAALAAGHASHYWPKQREGSPLFMMVRDGGEQKTWNPHLQTVYGKADLLDLMLDLPLNIEWLGKNVVVYWLVRGIREYVEIVEITNNDKHAALARAVIEAAARVGDVMRNNTMRGEV